MQWKGKSSKEETEESAHSARCERHWAVGGGGGVGEGLTGSVTPSAAVTSTRFVMYKQKKKASYQPLQPSKIVIKPRPYG